MSRGRKIALSLTAALAVIVTFVVRAQANASITAALDTHDLVLRGKIVRSEIIWPEVRVDAIGSDPQESHFAVQLAVEAVPKGTWDHPDFNLVLHSPSMAFWMGGDVGDRHLVFLDRHSKLDGGWFLTFEESRHCAWPLSPCP